jgi:hypothetical protein
MSFITLHEHSSGDEILLRKDLITSVLPGRTLSGELVASHVYLEGIKDSYSVKETREEIRELLRKE